MKNDRIVKRDGVGYNQQLDDRVLDKNNHNQNKAQNVPKLRHDKCSVNAKLT